MPLSLSTSRAKLGMSKFLPKRWYFEGAYQEQYSLPFCNARWLSGERSTPVYLLVDVQFCCPLASRFSHSSHQKPKIRTGLHTRFGTDSYTRACRRVILRHGTRTSKSGFCLVSVLPYPGGGGGSGRISGWVGVQPPPPQGGVGLCGGPWVYRASATSFFLLLQVPCNMFIYGVFTCHCISRVHAPRP